MWLVGAGSLSKAAGEGVVHAAHRDRDRARAGKMRTGSGGTAAPLAILIDGARRSLPWPVGASQQIDAGIGEAKTYDVSGRENAILGIAVGWIARAHRD